MSDCKVRDLKIKRNNGSNTHMTDHTYSLLNCYKTEDLHHQPISLLFWNVNGKRRFLNCFNNLDMQILNKNDVIFLSESWCTHPQSTLSGKDFFCSEALMSQNGGRPSGGLELYSPVTEFGKLISKTRHHIAIKLKELIVIGVYYRPDLDFDEKIHDLVCVLTVCNNKFPRSDIVLGGDFNLHHDSYDFENLTELLLSFDIVLRSNPTQITFIGNRGNGTTPDYIFCSNDVLIKQITVPTRIESDHQPLRIVLDYPIDKVKTQQRKKLNIDLCKVKLQSLNDQANDISSLDLASKIGSILADCLLDIPNKINTNHKITLLREDAKEALQLYQRYKNDFFKQNYLICRRELHREIAIDKRRQKENQVMHVLRDAQEHGIKSLYKHAKQYPNRNSSCITLERWYEYYSELYQTFEEPLFKSLPVVPNASGLKLLHPVTVDEICVAIKHQKSNAKGFNGTSPTDIKRLIDDLAPLLCPIFNKIIEGESKIPTEWMTSVFFFLHKKGAFDNPANYRSLAIEDPLLKIFTHILCARLTDYCESNSILPTYQFGFRKHRSTNSATSILKHCIKGAFQRRKKVYACFVDYKKAFDLVNRSLLCQKLQTFGVPTLFSKIVFQLLADLEFRVRSSNVISPPFESFNGVPQGDPLSPLLYSIFTADFPNTLDHEGINLGNAEIKYLLYADDLVLIAASAPELQSALRKLEIYSNRMKLTVNIQKTKCMIFSKGSCRKDDFYYNNEKLENVNAFTYLGIVFTMRLSNSKHVKYILSKCRLKIGLLFSKLCLKNIPLSIAINVFNVYVLPIVTYGLPVWYPDISETSKNSINSMLTKFLKRYLGIPYSSNNAITHFITESNPLTVSLDALVLKATLNVTFPIELNGFRLPLPEEQFNEYNPIPSIPSTFWSSPPISKLPFTAEPRRALLYCAMDLIHCHVCKKKEFHLKPDEECICRFCNNSAPAYHFRECYRLKRLTPCSLLKITIAKHS